MTYPGDGEYSDPEHGHLSAKAFDWWVKYQQMLAAETADERWERYQRLDRERPVDLVGLLDQVSRPATRKDVPIGFDPDDYPL